MMLRFHTQTAGFDTDRTAAGGKYRKDDDTGAGGRARRNAEFAYKFDGRGAWFADGIGGAYRIANTTGHRTRIGYCRHCRSVCRKLRGRRDHYSARSKARDYIEKIDAMGGMLAAIESGYVQREIQEAAYQYQRAVETNDAIVVGVNQFQIDEPDVIPILKIDERIEREQVERFVLSEQNATELRPMQRFRPFMSPPPAQKIFYRESLSVLNPMSLFAEMSNTLRSVWGEYQEAVTV